MSVRNRRAAAARGRLAEDAVAQLLLQRGYTILGRNVRLGHLEVDILARLGSVVAVVEVRLRGPAAWESALESVDPSKQRRLLRAAERLWHDRFEQDPTIESIRLDFAAVVLEPDQPPIIEYFEAAFE